MKTAAESFESVIEFPFPQIKELFAEATFEVKKLDNTIYADWDTIIKFKKQTNQLVDFELAVIWQMFDIPIFFDEEEELEFQKIDIEKLKNHNEFAAAFVGSFVAERQLIEVEECFEKIQKRANIMKLKMQHELIAQYNVDVQNIFQNNVEKMKDVIFEAQYWDIPVELKWWFFENFPLDVLAQICFDQQQVPLDKTTKQCILTEAPCLTSIFHCGVKVYKIFQSLNTKDEMLTKILKTEKKYGRYPLQYLLSKEYEIV